ncbi:MAG: hypothetical protein ACRD1T_24585 [Acidimicrobiia bacterium]
MMVELARHLELLRSIGMTTWGQYPPFVLKEPAPASDNPIPETPEGFREQVKPEFVDEAGGLRLPSVDDPGYNDFQAWYSADLQNKLRAEATAVSDPVREATQDYLAELSNS